jgi:branched-chain amino acid transport system substrate-binding protein
MLHLVKPARKMALAALLSAFLAFAPALTINPTNAQTSETLLLALVTSGAADDGVMRRQALQGAQFAVDLINAAGGVVDPDSPVNNPKTFTFRLVERAAPTNSEMRTALQASVEDKPIGIIGPNLTAQANNNLDLASTARIPQLISTPSDPTGSNGFTFRTRANDSALSRDLANYLARQRFHSKIATATDDSDEGKAALDSFEDALRPLGQTPSTAVSYAATASDLSAPAQTLSDADPQAIAVFGKPESAAVLVKALRGRGYTGQIVYNAISGKAAARFQELGGTSANGTLLQLVWVPQAQDAGSQTFSAAYKAKYNEAPDEYAAIAFDSVVVLAGAVKLVGKSPEKIRDRLAEGGVFGGVQGVYDTAPFTAGRLIESSLIMRVAESGFAEDARFAAGDCVRNCADTRPRDTNTISSASTEIVRFALISPQTGLDGEAGRLALEGAQLAINEINTAGGVLGPNNTRYKFELRGLSAATAEETRTALQTAISSGPSAMLGTTLAAPLLPNVPLVLGARLPLLTSASSSALVSGSGTPAIFTLRPVDSVHAAAVARYLTDIKALTRVATVAATTNYAQDTVGAFNSIVGANTRVKIVAAVSHAPTETNFSANVAALLAANPQAITAWTTPSAAAILLRELRAGGYKGLFAYGAISNPDFLAQLTPEERVGIIGPASWTPNALDEGSQQFVSRFKQTFGELPNSHAVAYYDAIYMLAAAVRENGPAAAGIQTELARLSLFAGVQGEYRPALFGGGQLSQTVFILESRADGQLAEISRWQGVNCINLCY